MRIVICDLDGTICDDRHRLQLIQADGEDRWVAYHAACGADRFMNRGCVKDHESTQLFIFTARSQTFRRETEMWLTKHRISPRWLMMRREGDVSPSVELKERWLLSMFGWCAVIGLFSEAHQIIAYDDRDDVLAMYRQHGVHTIKVGYDTP